MSDICWSCSIPIPEPPPVCLGLDYLCNCCRAMAESCSSPYWKAILSDESRERLKWYLEKAEMMNTGGAE
jgi:hypothetical protein